MSGRIIVVLLAVTLVLVQSKPASIKYGFTPTAAKEQQDVDSLLNQFQQETVSSSVVDTSATVQNQHYAVLRELLKNRRFVEQLIEFFHRFQQIYQYFVHGQSGSVLQSTQTAQMIQSSGSQSSSNNINEETVRGLFNNPSFLNFLSGFLQNSQGSSFFSHLSDNNAASQNQQHGGSQSHISSTQFSQQSNNNVASTGQHGFVGVISQSKPLVTGSNNAVHNVASSSHFGSVGSNTVANNAGSTSQHGFVGVTGHSKPLVAGSNTIVHNVQSSNNIESVGSTVVNNVASTSQHGFVGVADQTNAVSSNNLDSAGSNIVANDAASTSQQFMGSNTVVQNTVATNNFESASTNQQVAGSNTIVQNDLFSDLGSVGSNINIDNTASTSQQDFVDNDQFESLLGGSNAEVNTAASMNNVNQESSFEIDSIASPDQGDYVVNGHSRPVPEAQASDNHVTESALASLENEQIQTEDEDIVLDERFGGHGVDDASSFLQQTSSASQTSNGQQAVVSSSSGSSDNQVAQSSEALLTELLNGGASQSSNSYHSELSNQFNGIKTPQAPVSSAHKVDTSINNVQINKQQQIVATQQHQTSASSSSQAMSENFYDSHSEAKPVVQSSWSITQNSGPSDQLSSLSSHTSQINGVSQGNIVHTGPFVPVQPFVSGLQNVGASSESLNAFHEDEAEITRQAQNANYQFATLVNDNINGNFQQRAEIREGTKVRGKYSYDDGFVWRTVHYEADENGYRVTKEEVSPSHMKSNANGDANVQTLNAGNLVRYHITRKDIGSSKKIHQQQYGTQKQL